MFTFPNPVNEKAARSVAAGVVVLAVLALLTGWAWLPVVMAIGFALRVAAGPRFSPLGQLATRVIAPRLGPPRLVPGPPKRFAQTVGLAFTAAAGLAALTDHRPVAVALLAVLLVFAVLESAFGFCAGCAAFARLMRLGLIPASACEACAAVEQDPRRPAGWLIAPTAR